jgi:hypothetical protein
LENKHLHDSHREQPQFFVTFSRRTIFQKIGQWWFSLFFADKIMKRLINLEERSDKYKRQGTGHGQSISVGFSSKPEKKEEKKIDNVYPYGNYHGYYR